MDEADEGPVDESGPRSDDGATVRPRRAPAAAAFTWRGWVLVGVLVVSLLVIPGAILGLPAAQDIVASFGLTLRDAYLVLPLPAAVLLGAFAVWSALASRRR